jgi:DNA-binding NarL/FixJ family response regulator
MQSDRPPLTLEEVQVARLVAGGGTDEEIAARLGMSVGDVDRVLGEVLEKLALRSRTELALLLPPIDGWPEHRSDAG